MLEKIRDFLASMGGNGDGGPGDDMISCDEALERLFEYLDGELEGETEEQVARHFEICRRCYPRLSFEKAFQEALRRAKKGEEAPRKVRERVLELLNQEGLDRS